MRAKLIPQLLAVIVTLAAAGSVTAAPTCAPAVVAAGVAEYRFGHQARYVGGPVTFGVPLPAAPVVTVALEPLALAGDDRQAKSVLITSVSATGFYYSLERAVVMDSVPGRVHWQAVLPGACTARAKRAP